ncbi:MAG: Maf family protein [Candidatus Latescibacteria bacterium]|jgi:septum formation protein|nr:Maf family protein [Candidatus Latescibacterota bacterium]
MKKLILASASPRRASLLRLLSIPFEIVPSNTTEDLDKVLLPEAHVVEIAKRKTQAVASTVSNAIVLGADTVVALDNNILEKPRDAVHARSMLAQLSNKKHRVYTGLALIDTDTKRTMTDVAITDVTMRELSNQDIDRYVATGEPFDKAGGYGIQGRASIFIKSISGCFYNVVGLPLTNFWTLYHNLTGHPPWSLIPETIGETDLIETNV